MAIMKSEYIIFIFAVIILAINTANAVDTKIIGVGSAMLDAGSTTTLQVKVASTDDVTGASLELNLL